MSRENERREEHDAYGMIGISRIHGSQPMFGSHVKTHPTYIQITVKRGVRITEDGTDWYMGGNREVIRLRMSAAQFADMLTNMNIGDGVPCTLEHILMERMPDLPTEPIEAERVKIHFKEQCQEIDKKLTEDSQSISEILAKKSIGVADRKVIQDRLNSLHTTIRSNLPFVLELFEEASEKVVTHAKAEIDSFMGAVLQSAGVKSLKGELSKLLQGKTGED